MLIQANSGGGKSVTARVIMEEVIGKVPFIVFDIDGEYYTLKEKYGDILVIGGQFADIPISQKSVKLLPREIIGNHLTVIFDLSDLKMGERILYVKHFLETMMELPKQFWTGYLVFLEEAHKLCGEQDKQESATAVKDLMSRGRKMGFCGILITQRISKLHKDAAAECNNKFVGRTFLDIDMDRSAKELGFASAKDRLLLRDLKPGEFYAFGTAITPHHVHVVTIKEPQTKHPKAGSAMSIKPKAPTAKMKSVLSKLHELPQEAEKEMKNMQQLQAEVKRLKLELTKAHAGSTFVADPKLQSEISSLKTDIKILDELLKEKYRIIKQYENQLKQIGAIVAKTPTPIAEPLRSIPVAWQEQPVINRQPRSREVAEAPNTQLGKCPLAILQFLASFPGRSFTKAQVGIATGYSPNSGGFNNSLSELNTRALIIRDGGKLQLNSSTDIGEYLGGGFEPQEYSIHTFKSKLGKCEREIYEVLLANPAEVFTKDQLAEATPSNYSPSSGGFNNSLSTLNTLELIRRESGRITLNPELFELM